MAQLINLEMDAGVDFFARITAFDVNENLADLTGYTAKSQIRDSAGGALVGSFVVAPNGAAGTIDMFMDSLNTSTIAGGTYVYDIIIQNASTGDSQRLAQGQINVLAGVSV